MPRDSEPNPIRRSLLKVAGAAALTAPLAGCSDSNGETDDDGDGTSDGDDREVDEEAEIDHVTITQGTEPDTLDPVNHNDTPTWNVLNQAYEPLLYRDLNGDPIPNLASEFERVDDTLVELGIRDDVVFHNGDEMTADDVAFSINRVNDPEISRQAGVVGDIDEARVAGDYTVEIELNSTEPAIFRNLAAFGRVQQREWVEERGDDELATEINGTGPYQLDEFVEGSRVEYTRFDDYWGDQPQVVDATFDWTSDEGTRVSSLEAGDSDLITNVNPRDIGDVQSSDDMRVEQIGSIRNIFLVMPNDDGPFDSTEFRQAMNYAVDVDAIINSLLNEFGAKTSQPTLEGHFGHNPDLDPYPHDPEQAEQLIEDSGYTGEEITIHTPSGRYLRDTDIAATVADQIDGLDNVSASRRERETQDLFDETATGDMSDSPDIFLIGWGNPTFDAAYAMDPWFRPGPYHHFENDELVSILEEAETEADENEREELLQEANRIAHEEAAWVYLHQQYSIYGINDELAWDAREDEDVRLDEISAYSE